jgi:peptidoglycan/xylan/chitin deacetylase (PgdA/CDA1 family)
MILLYHRVARLRRDPWSMAVTPEQFESQLATIHRLASVVRLSELQEAATGSAAKPVLAITFDDGYEDNLTIAEPLLQKFQIPATVFVVAENILHGQEFWWDELESILLETADRSGDESWQPWGDWFPSEAHRTYREHYEILFRLAPSERAEAMSRLRSWAGPRAHTRPEHSPLSRAQLRTLSSSPVIDIGAHTASHPSLALLPPAAQRDEIVRGRTAIENIVGRKISLFSYPFGKQEHFSEETASIVREEGFRCACTNIPGMVRRDVDRFRLPRTLVPALEGEAFADWLRHCFETLN